MKQILFALMFLAGCGIDNRPPTSTEAEVVAPARVQFWGTCAAGGETCFRAVCADAGDPATAEAELLAECQTKGLACTGPVTVKETTEPCCWETPEPIPAAQVQRVTYRGTCDGVVWEACGEAGKLREAILGAWERCVAHHDAPCRCTGQELVGYDCAGAAL